ncbi:unnamed protein product [Lymnaea stagnalis]|uniref:Sushi domain-containing protein n=1 Tax=Lymnaea stagnalis TaxID=6523 RepID=A0AAV2H3U8_LYMST
MSSSHYNALNVQNIKGQHHAIEMSTRDPLYCPADVFRQRLRRYYAVTIIDDEEAKFECLNNFHWVSGSRVSYCENGSWSGEEPLCEVDYFKERYRLSGFIIVFCLFVSFLFLGNDFSRYIKNRREVRPEMARQRQLRTLRRFKYFRTRDSLKVLTRKDSENLDNQHSQAEKKQRGLLKTGCFPSTPCVDAPGCGWGWRRKCGLRSAFITHLNVPLPYCYDDQPYFCPIVQSKIDSRKRSTLHDSQQIDKFGRGMFLFRMNLRKNQNDNSGYTTT